MKTIKKLSALIAALILLFTTAHADWQPAEGNGPLFAQLFSLLEDDETDGSAVEGILQEICRTPISSMQNSN